jgi:hypothetical protein
MDYRDDQASLEARRDDLRHELAEMDRKAEALQSIARDREAAERELAAVEARLAHQTARRLPLLDRMSVAAPCHESWDSMTGDGRVRFCGSCEKNVYNLSAMARDEAERLLAEHEGSICVRYYQRADGTVMTSDCSVGVKRRRRRRTAIALAGVGAMAATAALAVEAMWTQGKAPVASAPEEPAVMGSVAMPVSEPPLPLMPMMGAYQAPEEPPVKTAPSAVKPPKVAPRHTMGKPTLGQL